MKMIQFNVPEIGSLSPPATGFLSLLGFIQEVIVTFFTLLTSFLTNRLVASVVLSNHISPCY